MNFCAVLTPRCQILIWVCKVFRVFQRIFACEKVKGNIVKRQKLQLLSIFRCQDIPKNGLHGESMSPVHDQSKSYLENYGIF